MKFIKSKLIKLISLILMGSKYEIKNYSIVYFVLRILGYKYIRWDIITRMNPASLHSKKFQKSLKASAFLDDQSFHWRPIWTRYINSHFFKKALSIKGDLIELGTHKGNTAFTNIKYSSFENFKYKKFYLVDSFEGLNPKVSSKEELKSYYSHYKENNLFNETKKNFIKFKNVKIIKGFIPEILKSLPITSLSFIHIDLNSVKPEVIAFKYLWKKLNKGGIIIFDDYAQPGIHTKQKKKLDSICKKLNIEILSLPTGNGLLIK